MAMKILKFSRFQQEHVRGQRALLTIKFLDDDSNLYSWAPRWADLDRAFLRALNVEGFNKPESEWLNRFANTVKEVAEGVSQPIENARKVSGEFEGITDRKLQISTYDSYGNLSEDLITPGFAISYDLLKWIGDKVEVLIINDVAVYVISCNRNEEYPPQLANNDDLHW